MIKLFLKLIFSQFCICINLIIFIINLNLIINQLFINNYWIKRRFVSLYFEMFPNYYYELLFKESFENVKICLLIARLDESNTCEKYELKVFSI